MKTPEVWIVTLRLDGSPDVELARERSLSVALVRAHAEIAEGRLGPEIGDWSDGPGSMRILFAGGCVEVRRTQPGESA